MRKRKKYNCAGTYKNVHKIIRENYGQIHLCGSCKFFTSCIRFKIQSVKNKAQKEKLMKEHAKFVTRFLVERLSENINDMGFIKVYECENFEFEEMGDNDEILLQQK